LLFIDVEAAQMVQAICTALIGVFLLAMSTIGYFKASLPWYLRIIAFVGALGLLTPGTITDLCGLAVLALLYVIQTAKAKKIAAQSN
ncbi:MAG: C4-dicarboxylate ABC transporter permease, partial [Synergistaceae bacterium]